MKKFLLPLLMFIATPSYADMRDWDTQTKVQYGILTALSFGDYVTTRNLLSRKDEGFYEANPLLGKHPSEGTLAAAFVASSLVNYYFMNLEDDRKRNTAFFGIMIIRGLVLHNNLSIGARLEF